VKEVFMGHLHTLRMVAITCAAAVLVVAAGPAAEAQHRPNIYCSESGDLCQSVRKVDGVRKLRILLAARYFETFHLCVDRPDGVRLCAPYRIRARNDGTFGRSVNWFKDWGGRYTGAYTVSWWVGDDRIGRKLGFHVGD
jgi:hypothetical protein